VVRSRGSGSGVSGRDGGFESSLLATAAGATAAGANSQKSARYEMHSCKMAIALTFQKFLIYVKLDEGMERQREHNIEKVKASWSRRRWIGKSRAGRIGEGEDKEKEKEKSLACLQGV